MSNKSEAILLTKSRNKSSSKNNRTAYTNSQEPQKSNFESQRTCFGTKTNKKKGYNRVQVRNSGSSPAESYKPLTRGEKNWLEKLLEAHLGIGL
jgi:hypothetical protein